MKVTKKNVLEFIELRKQYEVKPTMQLKLKINDYIENVINKDQRYYSKLTSYNINENDLKYLL